MKKYQTRFKAIFHKDYEECVKKISLFVEENCTYQISDSDSLPPLPEVSVFSATFGGTYAMVIYYEELN